MRAFPAPPDAVSAHPLPPPPVAEPWPLATWSVLETVLVFFATFGMVLYLDVLVAGVFDLHDGPVRTILLTGSQEILLVLPVLWWMRRTAHGGPEAMGLARGQWSAGDVGVGIATGLGLLFLSGIVRGITEAVFSGLVGHVPEPTPLNRDFPGGWIALGALIAVLVAPFAEEFLFRGFLFQGLRRRWSFWPAALLSGVAFAILHGSAVRIPELTVAGVVLAGLFESRKTLVTPIAAHMTLNLIAVSVALAIR